MQTNPVLASIDNGLSVSGDHVTIYFAADGEKLDFVTNEGDWTAYEQAQAMAALDAFAAVVDLTFSVVDDPAQAGFKLTKSPAPGGSLGFMNSVLPELGEASGLAWFNSGPYWSGASGGLLDAGSYTFTIFLHEFGHGLGLAHPHDNGGGSPIMPEIGPGLGLDQGIFTVMTYNDGWPESPEGVPPSRGWGWNLGPSSLDIAVLQAKYGANPVTGQGKTRYDLADENGPGTGYAAIWDVGGVDSITYSGASDAVIDLRAATLQAEEGGGGFVSHVSGIHGGFTIAHGVVIEQATSGAGDDRITGNDADNKLRAGAGTDRVDAGRGDDRVFGGAGDDRLDGQKGNDRLSGEAGDDRLIGGKGDDSLFGGAGADVLSGWAGRDVLSGGKGNDRLIGGPGQDSLTGGRGADVFVFSPGGARDTITDFEAVDQLDLRDFALADFADFQARLSQSGADARFGMAATVIVLEGFAASDLTEDMVLL